MKKKELRNVVRVGCCIRFSYARHNYAGIDQQQETRRIRITAIRDTRQEPLDAETLTLRPTLLRGRWLITGEDLDKGVERTFYLERMGDIESIADIEPLETAEYCVVEQSRVAFQSRTSGESLAFIRGRGRGVLCSVSKLAR